MRTSLDVLIRFTPRATGVEVIHHQGHIFLLSDLFLVCERISPEDRASVGHENADMWLCYPPLASKVLRVSEIIGQGESEFSISCQCIKILYLPDNALQVAIMRKEFLILETNTKEERNSLITHFKETIEFSSSCKLSYHFCSPFFQKGYSQYHHRLSNLRRLFLDCTQTPDHRDLLGVCLSKIGQVGV
jgi:hypothetical protein